MLQAVQVVPVAVHAGINLVGNPAGQRQAVIEYGFGTEQGMVDAAQFHAPHPNHRQLQCNGQIREVFLVVEGHPPAAGPFNQAQVCPLIQYVLHLLLQCLYLQGYAGIGGG